MSRPLTSLIGSVILGLATWAPLPAQVTNIGDTTSTPVPGGHHYLGTLNETTNPADGSVSLKIAATTPLGRKLTLPFLFDYESNGSLVLQPSDYGLTWNGEGGINSFPGTGGWTYTIPTLTATTETANVADGMGTTCTVAVNYVYQDATGVRHPLQLSIYGWQKGTRGFGDCGSAVLPDGQMVDGQFTDGGDDFVQAHTDAIPSGQFFKMQKVYVADADGTVVTFPVSFLVGQQAIAASFVEDRNGNVVSISSSGSVSYTDTLGRTAASLSYGTRPGTDTVTVSGLGGSYSATWGSATFTNTNLTVNAYSGSCSVTGINQSIPVISTLTLPNGQAYQFYYDSTYGELTKIVYPTGAYIRYVWGVNSQSEAGSANGTNNGQLWYCNYHYDTPVVTDRYVSYDGSTEALHQHFAYSTTWRTGQNAGLWSSKTTTVTTTDTVRNQSFQTVYTYAQASVGPQPNTDVSITNQMPVESQVQYNDWSGNPLRTVNKTWVDPYLMICESTQQGSLTSRVDIGYTNPSGFIELVNDKKAWNWTSNNIACGNSVSGTPLRETTTSYYSFSATPIYRYAPSILDRPYQVTVNGSGAQAAQTTYAYTQSVSSASVTTGRDSN